MDSRPSEQKILITGGCGFIGSNLAAHYLAKGWKVVAYDNFSRPGAESNAAWLESQADGRLAIVMGDIRDYEPLCEAMQGASVVAHLAAQVAVTTSVQNPREDFLINALGGFNVLEAARNCASDPVVLYASTNKVYGGLEGLPVQEQGLRYQLPDYELGVSENFPIDLHSPYGCSKGAIDLYMLDYARIYGVKTVVFRQSCIYGPRQFGVEDQGWVAHFVISAVLDRPITIYGDGKQVRDVLHVHDLIGAFDRAIENIEVCRGQAYNLGGGASNSVSLLELVHRLEAGLGRPIALSFSDWRPGDQKVYVSDIRKAERELGWAPLVGIEQGLDDLRGWVEANRALFEDGGRQTADDGQKQGADRRRKTEDGAKGQTGDRRRETEEGPQLTRLRASGLPSSVPSLRSSVDQRPSSIVHRRWGERVTSMPEKHLKIAVFHCGFAYSGGGERLVLEEVLGLRQLGHDVVCFAPTLDRQACFPDLVDSVGVKTFLPQLPKWFPLRDALAMVFSSLSAPVLALRFRDVDAFVGANQPGAWIAYCMSKVLGKPYIIYLNQPNRLIYPRRIDQQTGWLTKQDYHVLDVIIKRMKRFVAWADRISIGGAQLSLANGGYIAGVIEKIYEREMVLCPAGCHPQSQRLLRLNPHTAYEGSFKLGEHIIDKPFVLITNRHEPQKKFEYVIEAMASIAPAVPAATLVIPGPFTPHTAKLISLAETLGIGPRVLFLGQIPEADLQRLYREAAVYCYPAPEEDFGMGVIEAMAWGVPVVAWNFAGPTVTVLDGETGFLAEPYSVKAYADAMAWLLQDPILRSRMGAAARDRVERYFTWDRHVRILERAVRRAVGEQVETRMPVEAPAFSRAGSGPLALRGRQVPVAQLAEVKTGPLGLGTRRLPAAELVEVETGPLAVE